MARRTKPETPSTEGWLQLRIFADMFHDVQKLRCAQENRVRPLGRDGDIFKQHLEALTLLEHAFSLDLIRCYRRHVPQEIVEWQKSSPGIGEHTLARLLGHLGDPYIATPYERMEIAPDIHVCGETCKDGAHLVGFEPRPRTVSQLWSYCGTGDPLRKKKKGMSQQEALALGSPICKMLIFLLAEACIKQAGRNKVALFDGEQKPNDDGVWMYRAVYERARLQYLDREWTDGHQHNASLRRVKKEILKDLWIVRYTVSQKSTETQVLSADS